MKRRAIFSALAVLCAWMILPSQAHAMGKGRTKCSFRADYEAQEKNRLFLKRDVSAAMAGVPTDESGTRNDDLAGQDLTVTVNGTDIPCGTIGENGRINTETVKVRLTANGNILHVDLRGLDLVTLFPLDPAQADGKDYQVDVTIEIKVVVPSSDPSVTNPPTVLFSGVVTFFYRQKANAHSSGKNF